MTRRIPIIILFIILLGGHQSFSQKAKSRAVIQFSGVVVETDSLKPVPFTQITIRNTKKSTITDVYGFFSFAACIKDTVQFFCLGFKPIEYIIPDTLSTNRYSLIQVMTADTIEFPETVIYPWPTIEQFKQAFIKTDIPDDDLERAKKNLAFAEMKERAKNYDMDGSLNYKNYIQNTTSKLYYAGQYPPNNLLNPIAWAKFVEAWRKGKFKKQDED